VQSEKFDTRSVDYGLLIRTSHYGGRYSDKEKNENHYVTKVMPSNQRDGKKGRLNEQWDGRMEILTSGKATNI
jgi:hypothetical protein